MDLLGTWCLGLVVVSVFILLVAVAAGLLLLTLRFLSARLQAVIVIILAETDRLFLWVVVSGLVRSGRILSFIPLILLIWNLLLLSRIASEWAPLHDLARRRLLKWAHNLLLLRWRHLMEILRLALVRDHQVLLARVVYSATTWSLQELLCSLGLRSGHGRVDEVVFQNFANFSFLLLDSWRC